MAYLINKKNLSAYLKYLADKNTVYAPQKKNGDVCFKKVTLQSKVVFGYKRTLMSVKEFFLPPSENTFSYNTKTQELISAKAPKPFIVFGLNFPDLQAMTYLDEIMKKPYEDFFYLQKRNKATLVGLSNFTLSAAPGGDLILEKINETQYKALILSLKGEKLVKNNFFRNSYSFKTKKYPPKIPNLKHIVLDSELLADAVDWSWQGAPDIWDELAQTCMGCGICTYVCPLCYCFSIEDRVNLNGQECSRCRSWDSCTLPNFSEVAGGHNFHKPLKERYYNWFYHKFVRGYREYGRSLCVACGRCQEFCPAGIDIEEVLKKILKKYLSQK
jgi:sulfhydrogenase subunit beta (sulfur reductase)